MLTSVDGDVRAYLVATLGSFGMEAIAVPVRDTAESR